MTARSLPASQESEEHVIACCLLDSQVITRCAESGITEDSFYFPMPKLAFGTLAKLHAKGQPATVESLIVECRGLRPEEIGTLLSFDGKIPTTTHAGHFIAKVRDLSIRRRAILDAQRTIEEADSEIALDEFLQKANARISSLTAAQPKTTPDYTDLLAHRVRASAPPTEPVTRLFLADKPIPTAGNITTLTSKAKTGKTAALGAATAAIIAASSGTAVLSDTFGFRAANPEGHAVIIFDTEQSPYDAYLCYKRSLTRAGTEADPAWLHHYSMVGLTAHQLHKALDDAIALATKEHGAIFAIILDGVADFVASVNDEAESNNFVTWLRDRTVTHNCPSICVIHSNEGDKAGLDSRGHLGKQLIRKAESNLLLKKTGEVTTITSEKQRKAPITEADGIAFQWSDAEQRHVSCKQIVTKSRGGRQRLHSIDEFLEVIPKNGEPPLTGSQLHRRANDLKEIKLQTFKDLLADATKDGTLVRSYDDKTGFSYVRAV